MPDHGCRSGSVKQMERGTGMASSETVRVAITGVQVRALQIAILVSLPTFASLCTGCRHSTPPQRSPTPSVDTAGLQRAVAVAISALHQQSHYAADNYTLTSAQQILVRGQYTWRITFKPTSLIPKDPSKEPGGLGGEIFVNIDSLTQKTEIGFGE